MTWNTSILFSVIFLQLVINVAASPKTMTASRSFLENHRELLRGVKSFKERNQEEIQQSDYLKDFMLTIIHNGLARAYKKYGRNPPGPNWRPILGQPNYDIDYDVIIVGAGIAGLSAAYELKRANFKVKILEQTDRFGGRVFTYGAANGLAPGLFAEAGAMRLPGGHDSTNRPHFLTDGYIKKFNLQTKEFPNYDNETFTNIYDFRGKTREWKETYFDTVWPEWKKGIKPWKRASITTIDEYYEKTTRVVIDQLYSLLHSIDRNVGEEIRTWNKWINIWSQFTLESFLRSNIDVILAKVPEEARLALDVETLSHLLPWSSDAVRGYSVFSYTQQIDESLVQFLREQMGKWWSPKMHCLVSGMHSFPEAFFSDGHLNQDDIAYNKYVSKISYTFKDSNADGDRVTVNWYPYGREQKLSYTARAVIVTTPVNVLREITFNPEVDEEKPNCRKYIQAIEDIFVAPATKIFLQTNTRFWEKEGIHGGFSKTNLPIGQLYYVTPDEVNGRIAQEGLLLIYTWKNEAMIFGSMSEENVKREAIEQIAKIHPEIKEVEVSVCIVHAWQNQPSYQGAYGLLKITQYNNIRHLWEPMGNVYFAGETISFTSGWIQGALESGLKSAYQVYERFVQIGANPWHRNN